MYLNPVQLLTPEPVDKVAIIIRSSFTNWECRGLKNRATIPKREGKVCLNTAYDLLPLLLPLRRHLSLTTYIGCQFDILG